MRTAASFFILTAFLFTGCTALKTTGRVIGTTGKVAFVTGKAVGKVAMGTAKVTGKGVKTVVNMAVGKEVVKLDKKCNSLYVDTVLNRRVSTKLVLDTGCTDTQISADIARRLGIRTDQGSKVSCKLADGRMVSGRAVNLREVRLGRAKASNVRAIVLDSAGEKEAGLLGMSFLDNFVFRIDTEKSELVLQKR
ncbi:MAG: retroviral-like aspartic protease family protein [Candidatus Omnitrophica bacterium]|nr:retroviral-like aspartic protease family protein [Candidatus Omnitrophota bacterium]MBU1932906.1 retroviral-like aspartic protease family protein [Candidatus Omnitrophota bacterium]